MTTRQCSCSSALPLVLPVTRSHGTGRPGLSSRAPTFSSLTGMDQRPETPRLHTFVEPKAPENSRDREPVARRARHPALPGDRFHKYTPKRRFLTLEELAVLLANLPEKRHLHVLISVYLGPRLSEAFSLSWSDVNLDQGWVLIAGTKTDSSRRMVPIPPVLAALLRRHYQRKGRVLPQWSNIRRDLQVACENAEIERVTPKSWELPVPRAGIEPATRGFSVPCSTN